MEKENFILVSLDDPNSEKIAKVLSSKTSKKILEYLSENQNKSQQDISQALGISLTTLDYNIKQLLEANLIKKSQNFFWSKKGKKISLYNVSKKSIIFSPEKKENLSKMFSLILISILSGTFAFIIRIKNSSLKVSQEVFSQADLVSMEKYSQNLVADSVSSSAVSSFNTFNLGSPAWWFFGGFFLTFIIFILVKLIFKFERTYPNKEMKGGKI